MRGERSRRPIRARLGTARDEGGFTLIEVLVAVMIISAVTISTTILVIQQTKASANNDYAVTAANLADQTIAATETESFAKLIANAPPSGAAYVQTQTVGGIKYTIDTNTYWQPESTTAGGCDNPGNGTGSGLADILLVEVTVNWGMTGSDPSRADTLITPPVTQGSSSDGNFAIEVEGPAPSNSPMADVPVQVNGPNGAQLYYTDANGCLFLGYQTPGNYWFSASAPLTNVGVGWVNQEEETPDTFGTSSAPVTLAAGQTITQILDYSQGATINVNFTGAGPAPVGLPVTIANSSLTSVTGDVNAGPGTYTFAGGSTSVSSMTLSPVWVYANGYNVFAGRCPEADPTAVNSTGAPLYSSSLSDPSVAVTANQTSTVSVPLYPLTVTVKPHTTGESVAGYTAVLNEQAGSAKSQCTPIGQYTGQYDLVGTGTGGTTPASGTVTAGIPLGTFTVTLLKNGSPVMCGTSACASASFDDTGSASTASVTLPS